MSIWSGNSSPTVELVDSDYTEEKTWTAGMEEIDELPRSPTDTITSCDNLTVDLTQDDEMEISSTKIEEDAIVISDCDTDVE